MRRQFNRRRYIIIHNIEWFPVASISSLRRKQMHSSLHLQKGEECICLNYATDNLGWHEPKNISNKIKFWNKKSFKQTRIHKYFI